MVPESEDAAVDRVEPAAEAPVVSVIIVSYNTREMTLEAIESAIEQTTLPHEIIVLDNASNDGSAEAIAEKFPDIQLFAEQDNHGFARGNNIAARTARGEFILLLNPDTIVLDGAIDKLIAFARSAPDAKVWGGRTLYGDRSLNTTNCWAHISVWSLFCQATGLQKFFPNSALLNPEAYGGWRRDTVRQVDIVTGCFFLTTRRFWEELKGFDETFFMYGEEADLCHRAKALGARPTITPDAEIIHYVGASAVTTLKKGIMVHRAKMSLIRTHMSPLPAFFAANLLKAAVFVRAVGQSIVGRDGPWRDLWRQRREWSAGWRGADRALN